MDEELCNDYSRRDREHSKQFLLNKPDCVLSMLTPYELCALEKFGSTVMLLIKDSLKKWIREMRQMVASSRLYKPLQKKELVDLIMQHLQPFADAWEEKFGMMELPTEEQRKPHRGDPAKSQVHISSTGYGTKVIMGLLMADRIHVIEIKRNKVRRDVGYHMVNASSLKDDDLTSCNICYVSIIFTSIP